MFIVLRARWDSYFKKAERERVVQEVYDRINMVLKGHRHRKHLVKNRNDLILGQQQISWHLTEGEKKKQTLKEGKKKKKEEAK